MSRPRFYTTSRAVPKIMAEIMELLTGFEMVDSYHVDSGGGEPRAIAFMVDGVPYRLRPQVDGIRRRLEEEGIAHLKSTADPKAIAWAQLHALLELQLEAVESGAVGFEDVMGGFALTSGNHTVGDMIRERRGELLPGEHPLLTPGATS